MPATAKRKTKTTTKPNLAEAAAARFDAFNWSREIASGATDDEIRKKIANPEASAETIEAIRERYAIGQPAWLVEQSRGPGKTHHTKEPAERTSRTAEPIRDDAKGELLWPVDRIRVVYNDRKTFDAEKLEELAESIRTHGILQPLAVRTPDVDGCVELVAGERRLRAAKLALRSHVPVRIVELSDQEADEARLVENVNREGLTALEEAEGYQRLIDLAAQRGETLTQKEIAGRVGKSQPHVANRLRLLKLPKRWRERLAKGEITAHHAWAVLPYVDRQAFLRDIEERLKDYEEFPSVEEFTELVADGVHDVTRPLAWSYSCWFANKSWPAPSGGKLELTSEERTSLDVFVYRARGRDDEERCWNVKLWEKLAANAARLKAEAEARRTQKSAAAADKPQLTPAEKAARKKKLNEQYAKKLYRYKLQWLQRALVERLSDPARRPDAAELTRWLVFFATSGEGVSHRASKAGAALKTHFHQSNKAREIRTKLAQAADQWEPIVVMYTHYVQALETILRPTADLIAQPAAFLDDAPNGE